MKNAKALAFLILSLPVFISACDRLMAFPDKKPIQITDIKIAMGIDENLMPVKVVDSLPKDTSKVYCWFKWRNAKVNTVILTKWRFVTDDIPILDNAVVIPRREGMGSISLTMPEGKTLPPGAYRVDLTWEDKPLKSLAFKVE
jgi:hypothetical protein